MTEERTLGSLTATAVSDPARLKAELGSSWVLVGPVPREEAEWRFRTMAARPVIDASGNIEAVLHDAYAVFALAKKVQTRSFASTILLGRSSTNDVCVAHSSVSKLHARIRFEGQQLYVSDAGSSNGTFV